MLVIAFDSTQQALRMEMLLDYEDIESDTMPTPRTITAGCALSIAFEEEELDRVASVIHSENVVVRGIYRYVEGEYKEVAF